MQFVQNLNNLILDDQYFLDVPVPEGTATAPTGNIGIVGTFNRGPLNTPVLVNNYPDMVRKFGDVIGGLTGMISARGIFKQGNANVYVVRIDAAANPSKQASVTLMDRSATPAPVFTLKAKTPGSWGNGLKVSVSDGTKAGTYKITLQYKTEMEVWDNLTTVKPSTVIPGSVMADTVFGVNGRSALAVSDDVATATNAVFPAAGTFSFVNGNDGGVPSVNDYKGGVINGKKTGIYALDSVPVNFMFCAEQSDPILNQALMERAEAITNEGGVPRMALVTFPQPTTVDALASLTESLNSDRVIAAYPWLHIYDVESNQKMQVSPLGYFAGVLAQLAPHLSTGNKPMQGILGVDPEKTIGPSELVAMAQARVNAVGVPTPAGPLGVRGSFTLTQDGETAQIHVRRMKDYINQKVSEVGGLYVDRPITEELMDQVYHAVDNILRSMKSPISSSEQMIADYKVVCDSTNNPPTSIAQNMLVCDYAVKLLNINRFMIFRTQIGAGVVITNQA